MSKPHAGRSGRSAPPEAGFEHTRSWWEVPPEVVWAFVADLCDRDTFRGVAARVGVSPETVRKYVAGIGRPFLSTRKRFAELYLEHHPAGYAAERRAGAARRVQPPLRRLFPPGEEAARHEVRTLVMLAQRFPDEVPESAGPLLAWLEFQLAAEYAAEGRTKPRRKKNSPES
ncbi:MAG TPA: hypothetical protein VHG91_05040 [Longimicrobium sp.]|nr:hypothetical protein [Longimicrobium sp.]